MSQQSVLDSNLRSMQQIEFIYRLDNNVRTQNLTVLEKEKQTILEFSKGSVSVISTYK